MQKSIIVGSLLAFAFAAHAADPVPVAAYNFAGGSLASVVAGAPSLSAVDPTGTGGFGTAVVNGLSQTVYNFNGLNSPNDQQGGLTLAVGSLITNPAVYSVEIVFSFSDRNGAWRRILDVQSRSNDSGFYVDPGNNLDIFPVAGGSAFTNNTFHDVVLSVNNGTVNFYLDGGAATTIGTTVMNLDASKTLNFFLDNTQGGGQGEWSAGSVASIRVYNEAVSSGTLPVTPAVPEPDTYALMAAGLGVVGLLARRRRAV